MPTSSEINRVLSLPIKLHWAGWETDTVRLQQAGWAISVRQDQWYDAIDLALRYNKYPQHVVYGYTDRIRMERQHARSQIEWYDYLRYIRLESQIELANTIQIMMHPSVEWYPVDATPQMAVVDQDIYSIDQIIPFKRLDEHKQVEIAPPSFEQILKMALEHQRPKAKELREKARKRIIRDSVMLRAVNGD